MSIVKVWLAGHNLDDSPIHSILFSIAPDWLLGFIWRIRGDFTMKCEHVRRGEKPHTVMPVGYYRNGKLQYRVRIELCKACVRILP